MNIYYDNEIQKIANALKIEDISQLFRPANQDDINYLIQSDIPASVISFYQKHEPVDCIEINGVRLWPISELKVENNDATPGYILEPLGFFVISTTIYGDVFCLDKNKINPEGQPAVVLASHDEIYEGADNDEIRDGICELCLSFKEFLGKFAHGLLPNDFYDIKQD